MTIFFVFIIIIIIFILCTFGFSESSGRWGATSEAFIFSLNNNEGLAPFVSKIKKEGEAIYRSSHFGPRFGYDVNIADNADSNSYSRARLGDYYSVPPAVKDQNTVLAGTKYLSLRWKYFILTHPPKCKITQTIIFITIKSESEAMGSLI